MESEIDICLGNAFLIFTGRNILSFSCSFSLLVVMANINWSIKSWLAVGVLYIFQICNTLLTDIVFHPILGICSTFRSS